MDIKHIRNFCIIAHIDHGKSTLADRLLEITHTLSSKQMQSQVLDNMDLERERGITIKSHPIQMKYTHIDGTDYILNLIDTPGHVDFTYEVSRSLAACEGAILLVDATQGVEAQTVSNAYLAIDTDLTIIPIINKIDVQNADYEGAANQVVELLGCSKDEILYISAKEGTGTQDVLNAIIDRIPAPIISRSKGTRALIFDSIFDQFYPLKDEYANKVDLSWNIGLGDVCNSFAMHSKIRRYLPDIWDVNHKGSFVSPTRERTQDVFISTSANLGRPTVSFHRQEFIRQLELIANNNHNLTMRINEKRTSYKKYRAHIANTKIAPSPFGWGELGVRDYEAIIMGALLVKPDMTHLKTWPDIFIENETYIPFKWNFKDLKNIITEYVEDDKKRIKITEQSQDAYRNSISEQGNEKFCDWFIQQINL